MPNAKVIDAATWASLPEIFIVEGDNLAAKGLSADTYRLVLSNVASVSIEGFVVPPITVTEGEPWSVNLSIIAGNEDVSDFRLDPAATGDPEGLLFDAGVGGSVNLVSPTNDTGAFFYTYDAGWTWTIAPTATGISVLDGVLTVGAGATAASETTYTITATNSDGQSDSIAVPITIAA